MKSWKISICVPYCDVLLSTAWRGTCHTKKGCVSCSQRDNKGTRAYPSNLGLRYHVPTYPQTRPSMMFLFPSASLRAGSGSLLCYRLPLHKASRLCSCLSLIIAVHLNKTYRGSFIGDLHPSSSPRGIDYPTGFMPMPGVPKWIEKDCKGGAFFSKIYIRLKSRCL